MNFQCGDEPYEPEAVLASLYSQPNYDIVWYYNGVDWLYFAPAYPEFSTLTEFNDEISNPYFIKMTQSDRLELACRTDCPECGNGEVEGDEECDWGEENGQECTPEYSGSCDYCTTSCTWETLTDGYCGDEIIQEGYEDCEFDSDCEEGYYCDGCSCVEETPA